MIKTTKAEKQAARNFITELGRVITLGRDTTQPRHIFEELLLGDVPSDELVSIIGFTIDMMGAICMMNLIPGDMLDSMCEKFKEGKQYAIEAPPNSDL